MCVCEDEGVDAPEVMRREEGESGGEKGLPAVDEQVLVFWWRRGGVAWRLDADQATCVQTFVLF